MASYTNALLQTIAYAYDDAGRQTLLDYPTGVDTTFGYDSLGRNTSMTDAVGVSSWAMNVLGQVTSLSTPQVSFTYTYNSLGQPATMVDSSGMWTTLYDAYHRAYGSTNPWGETSSVVFDTAGRVSRKNIPNGLYELFTYDVLSRVTQKRTFSAGSVLLDTKSYTYDAASRITTMDESGIVTNFGFDLADRLVSEQKPSLGYSASYTYDACGNRLTKTLNGVTESYSYDTAGKLLGVTGGADPRTYVYTADRLGKIQRAVGDTVFSYDYDGRVTGISYPGGGSDSYTYNGLGSRVGASGTNGNKTFRRNGVAPGSPLMGDGTQSYTPNVSARTASGGARFQHSGLSGFTNQTGPDGGTTGGIVFDSFGLIIDVTGGGISGGFGYGGGGGVETDGGGSTYVDGAGFYEKSAGRMLAETDVDGAGSGGGWSWQDKLHLGLDIAGTLDPFGVIDVGHAGWYLYEGDYLNAGLTGAGIIPIVGDIGKIGKYGVKGLNFADDAVDGIRQIVTKGCFTAGTPILMADGGTKPIEEVQVGDRVVTFDDSTGQVTTSEVVRTFVLEKPGTYTLTFSDGDRIEATAEHPFYVEGKGWIHTRDLAAGSDVKSSKGAGKRLVSSVYRPGATTVYNFEVKRTHTYFVGRGKLVHNDCGQKFAEDVIIRWEDIKSMPPSRGKPAIGTDDLGMEIHHVGQKMDNGIEVMTATDHRLGSNFKKNHPLTGPSQIDRGRANRERKHFWNMFWDFFVEGGFTID